MSDAPELVGDKLRQAILIVWFLNKFNENISTAAIRKMAGYEGSGIYSAMESGWFKVENGVITLSPDAELVCEKKILPKFKIARTFILYLAYTPLLLILNEYLVRKYSLMLRFNYEVTLVTIFVALICWLFFYRIAWFNIKRKKE